MKKVLFFIGTRPEAIKLAPVIKKFQQSDFFEVIVCLTAQHREMLDIVVDFFKIKIDFDLDLMRYDQSLHELTAAIITRTQSIISEIEPDYIMVQGDTTTAMASCLSGFYSSVKICHIEAGLRTNNKHEPFPEEINRQIISKIADYHFAPSELSKRNLIEENIDKESIIVTGNTVIDALFLTLRSLDSAWYARNYSKIIDAGKKIVLVTGHRRENHGDGLRNICLALNEISKFKDVAIIWPVHPNPNVLKSIDDNLNESKNIILKEPLPYEEFIWLMSQSYLIITDSGGIQEEAPSLGKPVLVTRNQTERHEGVLAGTVIMVGTESSIIINKCEELLNNNSKYEGMSSLMNPYGDGNASDHILSFMERIVGN